MIIVVSSKKNSTSNKIRSAGKSKESSKQGRNNTNDSAGKKVVAGDKSKKRSVGGKKDASNDFFIPNWDVDIWYAAILVLLVGVAARVAGESIANTLLSGITAGLFTIIITIVMVKLMKILIKQIFADERKQVLETIPDLILCCFVVIVLGVICRGMIGENYLIVIIFSSLSMVVSYFKVGTIIKEKLLPRIKKEKATQQ